MSSNDGIQNKGAQELLNDVLWQAAKHFLHPPRDVLALALTSQNMWEVLHPELLITDVLFTKTQQLRRDHANPVHSEYHEYLLTGDTRKLPNNARQTISWPRRAPPGPQPPLHQLIQLGRTQYALQYIERAMVHWPDYLDLPDRGGYPPLHLAAMRANIDIVRRLIEAGSFISAEVYLCSSHYKFPASDQLQRALYAGLSGNCLSLQSCTDIRTWHFG
ncbi:hypothetical protein DL771_006475 [Monosporascus sp. 5C6A]|nr:hypothetical protein DL771_006475 [Monosporascus sp. 5C6A]